MGSIVQLHLTRRPRDLRGLCPGVNLSLLLSEKTIDAIHGGVDLPLWAGQHMTATCRDDIRIHVRHRLKSLGHGNYGGLMLIQGLDLHGFRVSADRAGTYPCRRITARRLIHEQCRTDGIGGGGTRP